MVESPHARVVKKTPMLREELTNVKVELAGDLRNQVVEATIMVCPSEVVYREVATNEGGTTRAKFQRKSSLFVLPGVKDGGRFYLPEAVVTNAIEQSYNVKALLGRVMVPCAYRERTVGGKPACQCHEKDPNSREQKSLDLLG